MERADGMGWHGGNDMIFASARVWHCSVVYFTILNDYLLEDYTFEIVE
jgi:hypothetical protein